MQKKLLQIPSSNMYSRADMLFLICKASHIDDLVGID